MGKTAVVRASRATQLGTFRRNISRQSWSLPQCASFCKPFSRCGRSTSQSRLGLWGPSSHPPFSGDIPTGRGANMQLARAACTNESDNGFLFIISASRLRDTAGLGACILFSGRANHLAACDAAFVPQTRLRPSGIRASASCGRYCRNVLPAQNYAGQARAASPDSGKCYLPVISRK